MAWYNGGMDAKPTHMWDIFDKLVLDKLTLRTIREEMLVLGYDLSSYDDATLVCHMLKALSESESESEKEMDAGF